MSRWERVKGAWWVAAELVVLAILAAFCIYVGWPVR